MNLYEVYSCHTAFIPHFLRPHTALDFADMGFTKKEHAQTRLAYTSSYRIWKPAFQKRLMIHKILLESLTS